MYQKVVSNVPKSRNKPLKYVPKSRIQYIYKYYYKYITKGITPVDNFYHWKIRLKSKIWAWKNCNKVAKKLKQGQKGDVKPSPQPLTCHVLICNSSLPHRFCSYFVYKNKYIIDKTRWCFFCSKSRDAIQALVYLMVKYEGKGARFPALCKLRSKCKRLIFYFNYKN